MGTGRVRVADESGHSPGSPPDAEPASRRKICEVFGRDIAELAASLRGLTTQLGELFVDLHTGGGYELEEVQVRLKLSPAGGFNVIGSGKGAIASTFASGRAVGNQNQG